MRETDHNFVHIINVNMRQILKTYFKKRMKQYHSSNLSLQFLNLRSFSEYWVSVTQKTRCWFKNRASYVEVYRYHIPLDILSGDFPQIAG